MSDDNRKPLPDADYLRSVLSYDPDTGIVRWRVHRKKMKPGMVAGGVGSDGYMRVCIDRQSYKLARIIWKLQTGNDPTGIIDHRDGCRTNNILANLHDTTESGNLQNLGITSRNKSGFTGVDWVTRKQKWRARICVNGKRIELGYYDTVVAAAGAYTDAKKKFHKVHPNVVARQGTTR